MIIYKKGWYSINGEKDDRKLVKMIWTCTKKATKGVNQKSKMNDFHSSEKERKNKKNIGGS